MVHPSPRGRVSRRAYTLVGLLFVGLGIAGWILPVMPGTVFFILALFCFRRGSARMEAWLLNHPRVGATLRDWEASRSIRRRTKILAIGMIWAAFAVSIVVAGQPWLQLLLLITALGLTAYLWTRAEPTHASP